MKTNDWKELKNKAVKELKQLLQENREKLRELRFSINANQQKDVKSLNRVKKTIAKILTLINSKK